MTAFSLDDVRVLEEGADGDESVSLQRAINSGTAWSLQGSYGRSMSAALEAGDCMLGPNPAKDYWGNYIPSRSQVKPGTKGSREYVVAHHDEDWAKKLEAV